MKRIRCRICRDLSNSIVMKRMQFFEDFKCRSFFSQLTNKRYSWHSRILYGELVTIKLRNFDFSSCQIETTPTVNMHAHVDERTWVSKVLWKRKFANANDVTWEENWSKSSQCIIVDSNVSGAAAASLQERNKLKTVAFFSRDPSNSTAVI